MGIYLGNLMPEDIERRTGIALSDDDKAYMRENHQAKINDIPLESGKWHCYDIPFMLMVHDKPTAVLYRDMLAKYDWSKSREAFRIGWEA